MKDLLPYVITGLASGSVYGLAGMGLVLTYKTSGIFNFAYGAVAAVGGYFFYALHEQIGLPAAPTAVFTVVVLGPVMGVGLELIARRLAGVSLAMKIVGTVGLLIAIQSVTVIAYGAAPRYVSPFLPTGAFNLGGVRIGFDQLIVMVIAAGSAAGLYLLFKRSRVGLAMQAVVDDPDLLALMGTSPRKTRRWAWVVGSAFAALSGVLLVPSIGLDALLLTLLVVQAFGAAAIGAFSSLPLTYAGGIVVGVLAAVSTKYVGNVPQLAGLPPSVPFLVLFIVLLALPRHRISEARSISRHLLHQASPYSSSTRRVGFMLGLVTVLLVPWFAGARLVVFTNGLIFVIVFFSLHLLVRLSGQVSLCQSSFVAIGASTFAHLTHGFGLPWGAALILAGLAAVPLGAVVAIPAIRLSGLYLAIATFGFGILMERILYPRGMMFGATPGSRSVPRPELPGLSLASDTRYYYLVLVVVVLLAVAMAALVRSRLGRLLRGLASSPVALTTLGANVSLTRVLVFCISACMAGVAGGLFGALAGEIGGAGFGPFQSLQWLTILIVAGMFSRASPIPTALIGGLLIAVVPTYLDSPVFVEYLPVVYGVSALTIAMAGGTTGAPPQWVREAAGRAAERASRSPVAERMVPTADLPR